jgi:uncharacterized membrane protein YfcA
MEIVIISTIAFFVSILTFFSGFGLGTILTPAFMLFFPTHLAIALTGVVHFFNNIFKLILTGKHASKEVVIKFGIPAVIAAFIGSWILINIPDLKPLFTYEIFGKAMIVYPVKFMVSVILIFVAFIDIIPYFSRLQFGKEKLPLGGILSGFFGGLSGNQGALRSAFLIKAGLSKEAFVGTTVVVSLLVDFTRLSIYATRFLDAGLFNNLDIVIPATLSAIAGAFIGNKLLKKVTLRFLQVTVAILLILVSVAMGGGLI